MNLTICYITFRQDPKIEWFFESLKRELASNNESTWPRIVVVDFKKESHWIKNGDLSVPETPWINYYPGFIWTTPKPSVWQGTYRLTTQDFFAASNARNTGLCLAPDGWIAYVDDLSVLMPGWLNCIKEAMAGNYIVCGSYRKVKNLAVEDGYAKSFTEIAEGMDNRVALANADVTSCEGGWLFGCSVAGPVEAFLTVNGFPEICDGLGFEDCCMGVVLKNAGFELKFDKRMLTLESEEDHHTGPVFRKDDWHFVDGVPVLGGNGADDKSHAVLNISKQSKSFPNYCDFRILRQRILAGELFPINLHPAHDWYTKLALKDL